jgi:DNA-binding MurR/RpiR family transcriptional regulator
VATAARQAGATVIALTGQAGPLLDLADVGLVVRTFEDTDSYTPTISRLAALVVIDILATGVLLRRGADGVERVRAMKRQLAAMRGSRPGR